MTIASGIRSGLRSGIRFGLDPGRGYPITAAEMTRALAGLADFSGGAGYLCDETNGNLAAVFGAPATLTVSGAAATYGLQGARGGSDKAIAFADGAAGAFSGGDAHNLTGVGDIVIPWVGYLSALPAAQRSVFNKRAAGAGWWLRLDPSVGFSFRTNTTSGSGTGVPPVGEHMVGISVVERSTGRIRSGIRTLLDGDQFISTEVAIAAVDETNVASFAFGQGAGMLASPLRLSALYIATGSGVAVGLSSNLTAALQSFAAAVAP